MEDGILIRPAATSFDQLFTEGYAPTPWAHSMVRIGRSAPHAARADV